MAPATPTITVARLETSAYRIPTDRPEADGTFSWDSTTMLLVEAVADSGQRGLGFSYCAAAAAGVAQDLLAPAVVGHPVDDVGPAWEAMVRAVRNVGRAGIAATAIAAVDVALWDLKAHCAGLSLFRLLGAYRQEVPIYGSGGFTSYTDAELAEQLGGWVAQGIPRVKIKVGRHPLADPHRLEVSRAAIGDDTELFADANGAFHAAEALAWAQRYAEHGVVWFEEPVSSDDKTGLRLVRDRAPAGMAIAAGEYASTLADFVPLAEVVHVLQADATRCGGVSGFVRAAGLAQAGQLPFSAHCCPSIHAHAGCAAEALVHLEYFHDHARIEGMLFDGVLEPDGGALVPDLSRPGLGLELREDVFTRYEV
jgi:L-alanine-DL-glutamate epimerase-like enolase superfamily enzyme